jgi:hypothetical protein
MPLVPRHIGSLATALVAAEIKPARISIGEIVLKLKRVSTDESAPAWQLLHGKHEYQIVVGDTQVALSIQLFLNPRGHYRVFVFSGLGMLFSVNFTTAKEADGAIALTQRIKFAEGRSQDLEAATLIRQAKARILCDIMIRSGFTVTDNLEVVLGTFSAKENAFLDTTPAQFLTSLLGVALIKGHFQGNKGFQFSCLPRFDDTFQWKWSSAEVVRGQMIPNRSGANGDRAIPAGLRYQVLERDRVCRLCGRGPGQDGVQLHIDHIQPYSLGGLTVLTNLQVLCNKCNLGKGNRSNTNFTLPNVQHDDEV